ncbi:Histidine decarboxylase [uncultured Synechococcales cyanobacterium]|uniref:Histidine decarboxylase n=1 Tax=uncultured Synechococcales cyanobacterium TaxID=1936017 RepID=A0A6J4VX75_9CYAN|nr:Histidine decarboxylase [uncultured Synechococcales cyanobacterium]
MLNKNSNTVVFQKPSDKLIKKWQLAAQGDLAHIVVMPNISQVKIDQFIDDLLHESLLACKDLVQAA